MNYRTTHAFNSLRDIVDNISYRTKYAADGYDSSMPDDPSGDGFRDPVTGSQFTEYTDDYSNTNPFTPDIDGPEPSLSAENQQENSGSDFDIYVSGEGPDGQDGCKTTKDDPGTSMPAEAGEEKYSAYLNYSMEENIDGFNKCAGLWLSMYQNDLEKTAGYAVMNASEFPFTKQAFDNNLPGEIVAEIAALESLPYATREKLASMSNGELAALMDEANANYIDASFCKQAEDEAIGDMSVDDAEAMGSMDEDELADLADEADADVEDVAEAADGGDIELDDEDLEALESLDDEDIELLDSLEPEELEDLIDEAAEDSDDLAEGNIDDEGDLEAIADDMEKESSLSPLAMQMYMQKLAEDLEAMGDEEVSPEMEADAEAALDSEVSPEAEEEANDILDNTEVSPEAAADAEDDLDSEVSPEMEADAVQDLLEDLPPDVADALVDMDPDELQDVIDEAEGGGGDLVDEDEAPELLSQMADETGGDEETALNDLSSAMTEEDVSPEELADMGKEGSWHFQRELVKLAAAVKAYRDAGLYRYTRPRTTKEAYARAQMHSFLNEIR